MRGLKPTVLALALALTVFILSFNHFYSLCRSIQREELIKKNENENEDKIEEEVISSSEINMESMESKRAAIPDMAAMMSEFSSSEKEAVYAALMEKDVMKLNKSSSSIVGDGALFTFAAMLRDRGHEMHPMQFAKTHLLHRLIRELAQPDWPNDFLEKSVTEPKLPKTRPQAPPMPFIFTRDDLEEQDDQKEWPRVGDMLDFRVTRPVLVATTWRSGSTFLAASLARFPGTFYSFEPLHAYHGHYERVRHDDALINKDMDLLESLFKCQVDSEPFEEIYLKHLSEIGNQFLLKHNFRVWNTCENVLPSHSACFMADFFESACKMHPIRLVKTVRMRIAHLRQLLRQLTHLKVIMLVRDPRGVMNSRRRMSWCTPSGPCGDIRQVCDHLRQDVENARVLRGSLGNEKIRLIRYEDLSLEPLTIINELLDFLELPQNENVDRFVTEHTKIHEEKVNDSRDEGEGQPYGTFRNSRSSAFHWRHDMSFSSIRQVQKYCGDVMEELGYALIEDETQKEDEKNFDILIKNRKEIWPDL